MIGHQPDHGLGAARPAGRSVTSSMSPSTRQRRPAAASWRCVERAVDFLLARADDALGAVDDQLRRVDARRAPALGIVALAVGIGRGAERVGPADIVPVVDVVGERDDVLARAQLRRACASACGQDEQPWRVNSSTTALGLAARTSTAGAGRQAVQRRAAHRRRRQTSEKRFAWRTVLGRPAWRTCESNWRVDDR